MVQMKRTNLFLLVTIVATVSLIAVTVAGYYILTAPSAYSSNRWENMWNGMMGGHMNGHVNGAQVQTQNAIAPYFGVAFFVLLAIAVVGICGAVYFALFSKNHSGDLTTPSLLSASADMSVASQTSEVADSPYTSVLKTLTSDERKIIEVLSAHNGSYLQKYIRSEAGLSRLQTHRIVTRLAERGIVTLEKTGNTNTVSMAKWLK